MNDWEKLLSLHVFFYLNIAIAAVLFVVLLKLILIIVIILGALEFKFQSLYYQILEPLSIFEFILSPFQKIRSLAIVKNI